MELKLASRTFDLPSLRYILSKIVADDELYELVQQVGEGRASRAAVDAMVICCRDNGIGTISSARILELFRQDLLDSLSDRVQVH